jgi:hypothetical protein
LIVSEEAVSKIPIVPADRTYGGRNFGLKGRPPGVSLPALPPYFIPLSHYQPKMADKWAGKLDDDTKSQVLFEACKTQL